METGQKNLELLLHCENEFLEVTVHLTKIDMHTVMESVTVQKSAAAVQDRCGCFPHKTYQKGYTGIILARVHLAAVQFTLLLENTK